MRAERLNPYDTALEMRIAGKEFESGEYRAAEQAWNKAIAADKTNPAPRAALLKMLLLQERFEPAYKLAADSAALFPGDAEWQTNLGILANKLGHQAEAKAAWENALRDDPNHAPAHLYLAEMTEQQDPRLAMVHFVAYLDLLSKGNEPALSAPEKLIPILLRFGQCQIRAGEPERAERSFDLAQRMAQKSKLPDLQAISLMDEAQSKTARGRFADALPLYQSALRLDDASLQQSDLSASLLRGAALDWYNYGVALRDHGAPAAMAFASFVQSSEMFKTLPPSPENVHQGAVVKKAMSELEGKLGRDASKVRKDLRSNLLQALAVTN
jgi:tetratricopeptide (TPR) repeat protein